jgi:hypothetical protein
VSLRLSILHLYIFQMDFILLLSSRSLNIHSLVSFYSVILFFFYIRVSGGVQCHEIREALGVVAMIVPFNFPAMVPHWTLPIAVAAGNTVVLKPSEKVPRVSFVDWTCDK